MLFARCWHGGMCPPACVGMWLWPFFSPCRKRGFVPRTRIFEDRAGFLLTSGLNSRTRGGRRMLSYSCGPEVPLWEKTIGQMLDEAVERWGGCLALVSCHQSKRYTWRELRDAADWVARGLWSLGIRPGDRVGLWSTNCAEWVMLHMGCARAGAVLVNVNPAYRTHELAFTLRKSRMKAIFLWERDSRADYSQILAEARHNQSFALEHVIYFGTPAWEDFLNSRCEVTAEIRPEDVANIQYTSGTTGMPKGVMLTHRNQINNGRM